ncbi:MAG: diguanylate cyclase [Desulfotomaculaceae bacterium]|nr:diguanylate cyclase [Desulfotomaculaceae bacterium]MDD4766127.1 diguanylate cyclase [Desulfotomaculaceae bacterium]
MPLLQIFFWAVPIIALASYCLMMMFFFLSKKDKFIRVFMLLLAALIVWTASSLFMKMQLYPGVLFWNRAMVMGMLTVPFLLYCFISVFTNSINYLQLAFWGVLTVAAVVLNLFGLVVIDAGVLTTTVTEYGISFTSTEFYYVLGEMAPPLYIFMLIFMFFIIYKVRHYLKEGKTTYSQIVPIIAGLLIMFVGVIFNLIQAIGKYPVDILACFINALLIVYAIYKYRMLELRFMLTKGLVYSIFLVLLTGIYVYTVFFFEKNIGSLYQQLSTYFITFSALLIAVVFQPLYRFTNKLVDRMFYKADYSQRQALKQFSNSISNKLDLNDMAAELIGAVLQAIRAKEVLLMLKNEERAYYHVFCTSSKVCKPDIHIPFDNPIVKWLIGNNTSLTREELYSLPHFLSMWEKEKKLLNDMDIEVIIPIKSRKDLIGMLLLTDKINRTAYTLDDLDLLTYLGASSAIVFDNARLFNRAKAEALTDSLTNLYNHRYFRKALSEHVEKVGSAELSLLLFDLDLFKLYNDLYGHFEGDKALEKVASIMVRLVGQKGIPCRYGGEEFAIILPYFDSKRAYDLAEKIRLEIQRTFFNIADVTQRFLTASIGVCTYPHAAANGEELLKRADLALYTAKNSGKNKTVVYTPQFDFSPDETERNDSLSTIKPANTATIYALTAAIDAKDHYTFGHSQRVAEYATVLAGALGLDKSHLEIVKEAALLHDVGKIGIPENILTKTGRLTMEEYEIVKKHVEMSITIIKHLPSMNHVIPAVLGHHERWDGKGYPRGLKGDNIPMLARCLAVTDAFDALTSDRPYRATLNVNSALNEIENHAGTQFDPEIARLFISLVWEGAIEVDHKKTRNVL